MTNCPFCRSSNHVHHLHLKDYFLSQEEFDIVACSDCGLLFTSPRPETSKIQAYYDSSKYLSHQENNSGFIPRLYEVIKSINLNRKLKIATLGKTGLSVLDIGCGTGDFLHKAQVHNCNVSALEPNEHAREIAAKRLNKQIFRPEDISTIPDDSFDVITMWHVLEHVEDLQDEVHHLHRMLRNGGRLVIAVPNHNSYDAQYYKDKWAAWDVPRHLSHFDKNSMKRVFSIYNDLKMSDITTLRWDSYYISLLGEKYLNHSFPLLRAAYRGFLSNLKALSTGEYSTLVYVFDKNQP